MERTTSIELAKLIMGNNFIGPNELKSIEKKMGIYIPDEVLKRPPSIQFDEELLKKFKKEYILFLGIPFYKDMTPLTIVKMREHFGWDPDKTEPCFYNQDWYLNEKFAKEESFNIKWYLIKKNVFEDYRGLNINEIKNVKNINLLPAVLITNLFFLYYLINDEILWRSDYIWCNNEDCNNDQIYVGKYLDSKRINKNGWEIHRHLNIKKNYSVIIELN